MDERGLRDMEGGLGMCILTWLGRENERSCEKIEACGIQIGKLMEFVHTAIWIRGTFFPLTHKRSEVHRAETSRE